MDPLNSNQSEATLDQANIAMRAMPWYQDLLKSWGQDPNGVKLSKDQSKQVLKAAQANGFVIDEGNMHVDPSGNIDKNGHAVRNTLIVAGIAGATIATMGAAGAFGAAALGPTTAGSMAATTAAAGAAPASIAAMGGTTAALGGGGASLWSQAARLAGPVGSAIGKATSAAGNNRLNQENLALQANRDNISGNTAAENALMNRSEREALERRSALIDVARASDTRNPNVSQFNTHAPAKYSDEYMSTLTALEQAGVARLKADPTYSTNNMTPLRSYQPLDITNLQGATNTKPSLMERIGQYAGPVLSAYGAVRGNSAARGNHDDDGFLYGG